MTTPLPDIAKLLEAVDEAWQPVKRGDGGIVRLPTFATYEAVGELLAAIRSARTAGYHIVLVSEEAVKALRAADRGDPSYAKDCRAVQKLARDLAPIIKEKP